MSEELFAQLEEYLKDMCSRGDDEAKRLLKLLYEEED